MYVLKRTSDGAYVNRPGSRKSYTRKLENAQKFEDREHAEGNACPENEVAVSVGHILGRR